MKQWIWILLPVLLLCGCGEEETMETISDEWLVPAMAQPKEISVRLPDGLVVPVLEQDSRQLYAAAEYELMLETQASGDLDATIRNLTGYGKESLTVIQTRQGNADRYEFVWTAAGESGDRLGHGVILDDGNYHYCLSVLRDPEETLVVWRDVFGSFSLV